MKLFLKIFGRLVFLLIGLFCFGITFALKSSGYLKNVENRVQDERFNLRFKKIFPDDRVVVVAIDEKSINELGRWPWSRKVIAKLVDNLTKLGAEVIAFDIVFSEAESEEADLELADAIEKSGKVVLGYFLRDESTEETGEESEHQLKKSTIKFIVRKGGADVDLLHFNFAELNIPEISFSAKNFGFFNAVQDKDGVIRNYISAAMYHNMILPSLGIESVKKFTKSIPKIIALDGQTSCFEIGELKTPCYKGGLITLNFYGGTQTFKHISASDIILNRVDRKELEGKIAIVGATEIGIYDLRTVPVAPNYPGVEVHATFISNMLKGHFLKRDKTSTLFEIISGIILSIFISFVALSIRNIAVVIFLFVLSLILFLLQTIFMFQNFHDVDVFWAPVSAMLSFILSESYRNIVSERSAKFLKKALSSYVSPQVMSEITKNPDKLKLGGEKREVTVLFSDIRGFTSISEKYPPEIIVSLLHKYLGPMTDIVMKNGGTLDKYIGDAIMAIWNAPIDTPDHAELAVKSAIQMFSELENLNKEFLQTGYPEIQIGVGINSGEAVTGNIGSSLRFDYTAIGDTVNLASRLEGLNKFYGTSIIISESTKTLLKNSFTCRLLDFVKVKGKAKPVQIYEISNSEIKNEIFNLYTLAMDLYVNKEFEKAYKIFSEIYSKYKDKASSVFVQRCKYFAEIPPPQDWDCSFEFLEK